MQSSLPLYQAGGWGWMGSDLNSQVCHIFALLNGLPSWDVPPHKT